MIDTEKTKKERLWDLLPSTPFNSHHAREIGLAMFYDSADRTCRSWAEEGRFVRITMDECYLRGLIKPGYARLAWWVKIN